MSVAGVPLASGWIDRDVATRTSPEALEEAWSESTARVLRLRGAEISIAEQTLALRPTAELDVPVGERVFLGRLDGAPVFAAVAAPDTMLAVSERWAHPFDVAALLDPAERELVTIACALIRWNEAAGFSPRDGGTTSVADGGWSRRDADGGELFPRMDPAVIVLIEDDDRVLLGSNALWETGRFSLLAGFVEAGETLEGAAAREVFEESGVRITNFRYVASQPWPFPRSLMLGFRAHLAPGQDPDDLVPDPSEISELRWFSRDEILNPPPGIRLPMGVSIAGWMLTEWAAERLHAER